MDHADTPDTGHPPHPPSQTRAEGTLHPAAQQVQPLAVADVRLALHALRHAWYEEMTPRKPFLFSATAISETSDGGPRLSMAEFGCLFDYAQHIKRHHRLVPRREMNRLKDPRLTLERIKREKAEAEQREKARAEAELRNRAVLKRPRDEE
jgi:hypothetical protein